VLFTLVLAAESSSGMIFRFKNGMIRNSLLFSLFERGQHISNVIRMHSLEPLSLKLHITYRSLEEPRHFLVIITTLVTCSKTKMPLPISPQI